MKSIHIRRLTKLAEHLEKGKLGHEKFDLTVVNASKDYKSMSEPKCGYAGCAMGELPIVFPRTWSWGKGDPVLKEGSRGWTGQDVEEFFSINTTECGHLFFARDQEPAQFGGKHLTGRATRKQVARNIRIFLKLKIAGKC